MSRKGTTALAPKIKDSNANKPGFLEIKPMSLCFE
jgi:hypothetical protein